MVFRSLENSSVGVDKPTENYLGGSKSKYQLL